MIEQQKPSGLPESNPAKLRGEVFNSIKSRVLEKGLRAGLDPAEVLYPRISIAKNSDAQEILRKAGFEENGNILFPTIVIIDKRFPVSENIIDAEGSERNLGGKGSLGLFLNKMFPGRRVSGIYIDYDICDNERVILRKSTYSFFLNLGKISSSFEKVLLITDRSDGHI